MKLQRITIITMILFATLTSACSLNVAQIGSIRIGMVGSNLPGMMAYSYNTFNGSETQSIIAEAGQTLALDYEATVSKGSLQLEVLDPDGEVVWEKSLEEDTEDQTNLTLAEPGRYKIAVRGAGASGSFHLAWIAE